MQHGSHRSIITDCTKIFSLIQHYFNTDPNAIKCSNNIKFLINPEKTLPLDPLVWYNIRVKRRHHI